MLEDCAIYSAYLNGPIDVDVIIRRISTCDLITNKNDKLNNNVGKINTSYIQVAFHNFLTVA